MFSPENSHLLSDLTWWRRTAQMTLTNILKRRILNERSAQRNFSQTVNASMNLLEAIQNHAHATLQAENNRHTYVAILCDATKEALSIRDLFQHLSAQDETVLESPANGALVLAAALGDMTSIEILVAREDCIIDGSAFFGSAIAAAGKCGRFETVRMLLELSKPTYNHIDAAIYGGNECIVRLLLENCQSEISADRFGDSEMSFPRTWDYFLCSAATMDRPELIDTFIEWIPIENRLSTLQDAFFHAVMRSAVSSVAWFLKAGVNISMHEDFASFNCLHVASNTGNITILKMLLDHEFHDLQKLSDYWERCAYDVTITRDEMDHVEHRLKRMRDYYNDSMHIAVVKGHTDIVQLLLERGADINCRFCNPFQILCHFFWEDPFFNDYENLAATNAAIRGDFHMFCFLVRNGAKVDIYDTDNWINPNTFGLLQREWLERIHKWEAEFESVTEI